MNRFGVKYKGSMYIDKLAQGIQIATIAKDEGITEHGIYLSINAVIKNSKLKFNGMEYNTEKIRKLEETKELLAQKNKELEDEKRDLQYQIQKLELLTKDAPVENQQWLKLSNDNKKLMESNQKLRDKITELTNELITRPIELDKEDTPKTKSIPIHEHPLVKRLLDIIEIGMMK